MRNLNWGIWEAHLPFVCISGKVEIAKILQQKTTVGKTNGIHKPVTKIKKIYN